MIFKNKLFKISCLLFFLFNLTHFNYVFASDSNSSNSNSSNEYIGYDVDEDSNSNVYNTTESHSINQTSNFLQFELAHILQKKFKKLDLNFKNNFFDKINFDENVNSLKTSHNFNYLELEFYFDNDIFQYLNNLLNLETLQKFQNDINSNKILSKETQEDIKKLLETLNNEEVDLQTNIYSILVEFCEMFNIEISELPELNENKDFYKMPEIINKTVEELINKIYYAIYKKESSKNLDNVDNMSIAQKKFKIMELNIELNSNIDQKIKNYWNLCKKFYTAYNTKYIVKLLNLKEIEEKKKFLKSILSIYEKKENDEIKIQTIKLKIVEHFLNRLSKTYEYYKMLLKNIDELTKLLNYLDSEQFLNYEPVLQNFVLKFYDNVKNVNDKVKMIFSKDEFLTNFNDFSKNCVGFFNKIYNDKILLNYINKIKINKPYLKYLFDYFKKEKIFNEMNNDKLQQFLNSSNMNYKTMFTIQNQNKFEKNKALLEKKFQEMLNVQDLEKYSKLNYDENCYLNFEILHNFLSDFNRYEKNYNLFTTSNFCEIISYIGSCIVKIDSICNDKNISRDDLNLLKLGLYTIIYYNSFFLQVMQKVQDSKNENIDKNIFLFKYTFTNMNKICISILNTLDTKRNCNNNEIKEIKNSNLPSDVSNIKDLFKVFKFKNKDYFKNFIFQNQAVNSFIEKYESLFKRNLLYAKKSDYVDYVILENFLIMFEEFVLDDPSSYFVKFAKTIKNKISDHIINFDQICAFLFNYDISKFNLLEILKLEEENISGKCNLINLIEKSIDKSNELSNLENQFAIKNNQIFDMLNSKPQKKLSTELERESKILNLIKQTESLNKPIEQIKTEKSELKNAMLIEFENLFKKLNEEKFNEKKFEEYVVEFVKFTIEIQASVEMLKKMKVFAETEKELPINFEFKRNFSEFVELLQDKIENFVLKKSFLDVIKILKNSLFLSNFNNSKKFFDMVDEFCKDVNKVFESINDDLQNLKK